ncbi:alpha/beta-hydrolase [Serendipita vermifera]|nr:alpha/beta-hydrolase [Serendipita vermifera]
MGKETPSSLPVTSVRQKTRPFRTFLLVLVLAGGLFLTAHYDAFTKHELLIRGYPICKTASTSNEEFDWDKLRASPTLHWVPCYDGFECARLEVPLDYHDPTAGKAGIAMARYPTKVNRKSSAYKGPILFNPGGPGGSGVGIITRYADRFQEILGEEFDLIGFDPRGIGRTTPAVDIFTHQLEREAWDLRNQDAPLVNQTTFSLSEIVAKSRLINAIVAEKVPVAAQHVNTAVVCTDMLSIIRAHGMEKLQYWGFSYGSVLGSSFAALYPNNVGRLVIDGVVDVANYYEGLWSTNLRKADKGLETTFEQCVEAGDECPFYESSADKVKERYLKLVSSLDTKPVTVHANDTIAIITRKYVHEALFGALYKPYKNMKPLFEALKQLENGNGLPLWEVAMAGEPKLSCKCGSEPIPAVSREESGAAVECTDGLPVEDDLPSLHTHFEKLANVSYFGDIWSSIRMRCVGWKIKPKWEWRGPIAGNTSFPILLVGNTEDPVTPDAKLVSKGFKDSVVVTQKSAGHCSLAATSLCTAKTIRAYFREGKLPEKNIVCDIEDHMFLNRTESRFIATSEEESRVLEALRALSSQIRFGEIWRKY